MFLGHVGVGLALKADAKINVGWLVAASLLNDIVLWALVLLGVEHVIIPPNYSEIHYLTFDFPYSHSLLITLLWSAIVLALALAVLRHPKRAMAGLTLAAAVLLHWVCDWIEHPSDLPLAGGESYKAGLGVWNAMPVALGVEILLAVLGLWLYLKTAADISSRRKWLTVFLTAFIAVLTVYGGLFAPAPPGEIPIATSSLATNILVVVLYFSLDRTRTIR